MRSLTWILIIVGAVLVGIVLVCLAGGLLFAWNRTTGPAAIAPGPLQGYASNGETIYFTGFNDRGERIPYTGGPHWLYRHGGGCAACHGDDGRGGVPVMMLTEVPLGRSSSPRQLCRWTAGRGFPCLATQAQSQ